MATIMALPLSFIGAFVGVYYGRYFGTRYRTQAKLKLHEKIIILGFPLALIILLIYSFIAAMLA